MPSESEPLVSSDPLREIEALRAELHRRMGGRYDPSLMAQLVDISQELDRLVVEYTRQLSAAARK